MTYMGCTCDFFALATTNIDTDALVAALQRTKISGFFFYDVEVRKRMLRTMYLLLMAANPNTKHARQTIAETGSTAPPLKRIAFPSSRFSKISVVTDASVSGDSQSITMIALY